MTLILGLDKRAVLLLSFYKGVKMKRLFYKYIMGSAFFALFLMSVLPSYAITFNEPRKVVLPKYTNAVYGSLSVYDKMYLDLDLSDTSSKRLFLMEIGKRPTFFWNNDYSHYLQQTQNLNLGSVLYVDPTGSSFGNQDIFTIREMDVKNGSFISEGMFLKSAGDTSITMQGNDTNLIMNYTGNFYFNFDIGSNVNKVYVYASTITFTAGNNSVNTVPVMDNVYFRDLGFYVGGAVIPFPSPRMMIYNPNIGYNYAQGTATVYDLAEVGGIDEIKNYYGPWSLYNTRVVSSGSNPCPSGTSENRCYKKKVSCSGTSSKSCTSDNQYDKDNEIFECAGEQYNGQTQSGTYDPVWESGSCYDYQIVNLPNNVYDDNGATYEFKVQEVLKVSPTGNATLVSQSPRFRTAASVNLSQTPAAISLSTTTADGWTIHSLGNTDQRIVVDGKSYVANDNTFVIQSSFSHSDICLELCNGKLCGSNKIYIRGRDVQVLKKEFPENYMAPEQSDSEQNMLIVTYTVGFCPKQDNDSNYTSKAYENNFLSDYQNVLMNGLMTSGYASSRVCMKRVVKCNSISGGSSKARSYRLLSTDY